jgi:hypothetical protein
MSLFRRRPAPPEPAPARPSSSAPVLLYNPEKGTRAHFEDPARPGRALCKASTVTRWAGAGSDEERVYAAVLPVCKLCQGIDDEKRRNRIDEERQRP